MILPAQTKDPLAGERRGQRPQSEPAEERAPVHSLIDHEVIAVALGVLLRKHHVQRKNAFAASSSRRTRRDRTSRISRVSPGASSSSRQK
jgi:hypothetical protein